jgi:hypothetical protein
MNPIADPSKVSGSFEDFQKKFYPKWCESQQASRTEESFGRDLARYSVHKHFPTPTESKPNGAKKRT